MSQIPILTVDNRATTDPVDSEAQARQVFRAAGWHSMTSVPEAWPIGDADALELLTRCGEFDIDQTGLADLIGRRILSAPAVDDDGRNEWSALDLLGATRALEERQQWKPTPSRHDCKKSVYTIALERARAADAVADLVAGDGQTATYDARGLLLALVGCSSTNGREMLRAMLLATLEVDHEVLI